MKSQGRRRKGGPVVASTGILGAAILIAFFVSPAAAQGSGSCFEHITIVDGPDPGGFGTSLLLSVDVSETTAVDTYMYTVVVDEDVVPAFESGDEFFDYFSVTQIGQNWSVEVKAGLEGLPDFNPVSQDVLSTILRFPPFSDVESCTLELNHNLLDENTQDPTPDEAGYTHNIREDFPVDLTLPDFKISVTDADSTSPNNQFTVTVTGCPLEASEPDYTCTGGIAVPVQFQLNEKLDYEKDKTFICDVSIQDMGTPQRSTLTSIAVTVTDRPDEPPVFDFAYYYTEVVSPDASPEPIPIFPEDINAQDGDLGIDSPIIYTMTDARDDVSGTDYFTIDPNTGDVTMTKNLDEDILEFATVTFIVTALDDTGASSTSILDVFLPPAPTTTPGTLPPPDTTLPVTCPTTTDESCPPCPTTETTTDCPECICPTTTPGTSSTPCPTTTITACPEVTCPTTYGTESSCSPCTTSESTECPECTCPTTRFTTEGTCAPCPTTSATTECPSATLDTCEPCPTGHATQEPTCPPCPTSCPPPASVSFRKDAYKGEIYPAFTNVLTVSVYGEEKVVFSWEEGEDDADKFSIDPDTGKITNLNADLAPGLYSLVAVATSVADPTLYDTTQVNIDVLVPTGNVTLDSSLVEVEVPEGVVGEDFKIPIATTPLAGSVCITGVVPEAVAGTFETSLEGKTWVLRQVLPLDYEAVQEVQIRLKAFEEVDACPSPPASDSQQFLRSEGLVVVVVRDVDDKEPMFEVPPGDEVIAYPRDPALQKVVGPVITLQATDPDTKELHYSLQGDGAQGFTVGELSGAVFVEGYFQCFDGCLFTARAHDGMRYDDVNIEVLPLGMDRIFTLTMEVTDVSEVGVKLEELSAQTDGASLRELYINPTITTTPTAFRNFVRSLTPQTFSTRRTRSDRGGGGGGGGSGGRAVMMSLQVHIYSIKDGNLMTLAQLNEALESTNTVAQSFADQGVFSGGVTTDLTGWRAAVGVLGALLGLTIVLGISFVVYRRRKESKRRPPASPISTLGGAYPNQGYLSDTIERSSSQDYDTTGTKNSINGGVGSKTNRYTAPPLIIHSEKESPPLYRSALSREPTPPPSRSGLRRTEPGSPEYYGSSSPSPPPYFSSSSSASTSKPSSSSKPPTSSLSSSSGLYPTVVTAAASSSSSSQSKEQKDDQDLPLTTFPSVPETKPKEPEADYESNVDTPPTTSKFSALKGSPPPKRSSAPPDSDEDEHDGVFFPGGKNKKEDSSDVMSDGEEKKSVAFKVLVDTKEIEPENLGPSQKKAAAKSDALDILEANKKKFSDVIEEEDEDGGEDDDDEEGDSKL